VVAAELSDRYITTRFLPDKVTPRGGVTSRSSAYPVVHAPPPPPCAAPACACPTR
jgi:hypothetical protein